MENAKKEIAKLVEKYNKLKAENRIKDYNEAQTLSEFIEPLFSYLGWDIHNINNPNEVTPEDKNTKGRVDRAFRINRIPKFFLEAKSMKSDLDIESYARQAINYSWNKGVTWAVLTDFEGIKVFNAQAESKKLRDKIVFEINCENYIADFDKLWLLSKESFEKNKLDEYAESIFKKAKKMTVDKKLFEDLKKIREILSQSFGGWNANWKNGFDQHTLDEGVQRIIDRLIFIRVLEDRQLEQPILKSLLHEWEKDRGDKKQLFDSLIGKFRELNDIYNSSLFKKHFCEDWEEYSDDTKKVIPLLYGSDVNEYDFKGIPADILGGVYESYLGYIAQNPIKAEARGGKLLQSEGKAEIKEKSRKKRKEQGIYYTPKFIVDYIIKSTLGEKLKEIKGINDLKKIKVLDPACGSGSFLTKALEAINDKYKYFERSGDQNTKTQILMENIYGVDLDSQAVELAKLNLLIDALDKQEKLPDLEHIKIGNSLISGDEKKLQKYFGKNWRDKKPFNWKEQFPEVFAQGGFDVIIGNPPYISFYSKQAQTSSDTKNELDFYRSKFKFIEDKNKLGRFNTVMFFIEKTINLLNDGGLAGLIVDMNIFGNPYRDLRKYLLKNSKILKIVVNLNDFESVGSGQVIIIFQKSSSIEENDKNIIQWQDDIHNKDIAKVQQVSWNDKSHDYNFKKIKSEYIGNLLEKIEKYGTLGDCYPGKLVRTSITFTGKKDYFVINPTGVEKYSGKSIFPLLEGSSGIGHRYCVPLYKNYVNYDEELRDKLNAEYIELAKKENKRTPMVIGLGSLEAFKSPKIFVRLSSKIMTASYSEDVLCADLSLYVIIKEDDDDKSRFDLKYTLAILNSKLVDYYAKENKLLKQEKGGMPQIRLKDLKKIPLYKLNFKNQKENDFYNDLINLSEEMLNLNKELKIIPDNSDKWNLIKTEIEKTDKEIDQKVYKLYGLTEDEIKIVENKT